ncbi:MAG: M20/M25/M40 family metallo-hydrolase [Vicinamibacterales bacterium]
MSETSVRSHMEFFASDALNGRGSGSRDEWITATYVASHLRRLGIEPLGDEGGYVQKVAIERSELNTPPVMTVGSMRFTHGKGVYISQLTAAKISGPLQHYREGTAVTRGAVLMIPRDVTAPAAVTAEASIVITPETDLARTRRSGQAANVRPLAIQRIVGTPARATVAVDAETYPQLDKLTDGTPVNLTADAKAATSAYTWNAIGQLKGSAPQSASEVILLTAHLDHLGTGRAAAAPGTDNIYNGADDDASGSVAVLELAETLARGKRPKRTVMFAWFGSEEAGGFGARHFIDAPPVPLSQIVANLEFEMIGRPDPKVAAHTLWLTGYERSNLGPELAKRGAKIVQDPHPEQSFFTRSDNIQLARRGVIAQTVSSYGLHKEYHTPKDEIGMVDFAHMTDSIRSMIEPIRWLTNSSFKPEWLPGKKP